MRSQKLSGVTQLSKTLFSGIIAAMLSTIVMAGGDQLSEDPSFKLIKKESGAPITAIATYDNGRSAFCGDSDGNIYCVSNGGYWKVVNAKASIDSIIIGNALTGNFCFTASGKAYGYKENNIIDMNLPKKITRLYRDGSSKEIYAIADTETDNVYTLSDNGSLKWESVAPKTAKKILANISARMDSDKGANSNDVSSYGKNFKGMQNGQIYVRSSYDREDMTVKVEYVSDAVNYTDSAIYRVTIKGYRLNTEDIFIKGYNGFKYTLSCDVNNTKYNKNAYPVLGVIYESDGKDAATLQNREISFLWLGPKCTNAGDHKLSVNEVAYNFSANTKDQIINSVPPIDLPASELPLDYSNYKVEIINELGEINAESNGTCAMPFNIVISDKESEEVLSAEDKDYESPDKNPYNHLVFYAVDSTFASIKTDGLIGCDLYNADSELIAILPADKGVIDNEKQYIVEVDGKYVKYGVKGDNCLSSGGKTFYAYININNSHEVRVVLVDPSKSEPEYVSATLHITGTKETVIPSPDNPNLNVDGGRYFTLVNYATRAIVFGSNWQGNQIGYGGYLDYQLTGYNNSYKGVFVYLPEGLNTRSPLDVDETKLGAKDGTRKNLCSNKLTIGYYFDPQVKTDNPLLATKYLINDTPSYCDKMHKKKLYGMLFDEYGRLAPYDAQAPLVGGATDPGGADLWENREKGKWNTSLNMLWEVGNLYNTPIIMGCPKSDSDYNKKVKHGITDRGLFVPPISPSEIKNDKYTGVNASFISDISVWIHGKDDDWACNVGKYKIAGYKLTASPRLPETELFFNTLEIEDLGGLTCIALNVTDSKLIPLNIYPSTTKALVTSVNRINIKNPGWMVSDWLDAWSIVYINETKANTYAYYYDFFDGDKGMAGPGKTFEFNKSGDYIAQECEGNVENYPSRPDWVKHRFKRQMYGGTIGDAGHIKEKPAKAWPITK